jgi:hypothetical protein
MDTAIQGSKGSGKSLYAVSLIRQAILLNIPVATNFDLFLDHFPPTMNRHNIIRLPNFPTTDDLELGLSRLVPMGVPETEMGILVLDEVSKLWNSRTWSSDKDRLAFIGWLRESRKRGWKVYYITQDVESLDSQFRSAMLEFVVTVRKFSRIRIPIFSALFDFFGFNVITEGVLGRLHIASTSEANSNAQNKSVGMPFFFIADSGLYKMYDTTERFMTNANASQPYTVLMPAYIKAQAAKKRQEEIKKLSGMIKFLTSEYEKRELYNKIVSASPNRQNVELLSLGEMSMTIKILYDKRHRLKLEAGGAGDHKIPLPVDSTIPFWKRKDFKFSLFKFLLFPLIIMFVWYSQFPTSSPNFIRPYFDKNYRPLKEDDFDVGYMFQHYPHRLIELTREDFVLVFKSGDQMSSLTSQWFRNKGYRFVIEQDKGLLNIALNSSKVKQIRLYDSAHEISLWKGSITGMNRFDPPEVKSNAKQSTKK